MKKSENIRKKVLRFCPVIFPLQPAQPDLLIERWFFGFQKTCWMLRRPLDRSAFPDKDDAQ